MSILNGVNNKKQPPLDGKIKNDIGPKINKIIDANYHRETVNTLHKNGIEETKNGDYEKALLCFQNALEIDPENTFFKCLIEKTEKLIRQNTSQN